ncbi:MAG: hypothetical protein SNJ78_04380 [Spirochaetales bacterium]
MQTLTLLLTILFTIVCLHPVSSDIGRRIALDGVPLSLPLITDNGEGWVITDAPSLVHFRPGTKDPVFLPLPKGVRGGSLLISPEVHVWGVQVWMENNAVFSYDRRGNRQITLPPFSEPLQQVLSMPGGYTLVQLQSGKKVLYSLKGRELLSWKAAEGPPLCISQEGLVLESEYQGRTNIRFLDGTLLVQLQFPHSIYKVAWIENHRIVGVSPEGAWSILSLEGKVEAKGTLLGLEGSLYNKQLSFAFNQQVVYVDSSKKLKVESLPFTKEKEKVFLLEGTYFTVLGISPQARYVAVGDERWILQIFPLFSERFETPVKANQERNLAKLSILETISTPAEQYFSTLAKSPFAEQQYRLIQEGSNALKEKKLHFLLKGLKKGLQILIERPDAGLNKRIEATQLLGEIGDGRDADWLGQMLLSRTPPSVQTALLQALARLGRAPSTTLRRDLFAYLRKEGKNLSLLDLRNVLQIVKELMAVSEDSLRVEELELIQSILSLSLRHRGLLEEFFKN